MANIMLQYGGTTYRTLGYTGRVTNPSLILSGGGQTLYTPLFAVASGAEGRDGNYYYKCCPLAVKSGGTTYRAAYQRRYAASFSRTISGTIYHSNVPVIVNQPTGTVVFSQEFSVDYNVSPTGGWSDAVDVTVMFNRSDVPAFISAPTYLASRIDSSVSGLGSLKVSDDSKTEIVYCDATKCTIRVQLHLEDLTATTITGSHKGTAKTTLYTSVNGLYSTTTYPDETKSVTASGDFSYGHTYGSAPSVSADNGVSVSNNSGNASFHASKTLTGTVSYNSSKTLSQAFNVSFSGAA